ncbi:type VI secretion system membrane subunit TssM [Derxia gummosa]|uniref:Type VI secretion system membrane subunit TssM n=1 Tax=Derxia gummosa DSM 723 TaxID=1121388 RepID=A0A8B6X8A6_9BURK|nr:type VI secretion system membrane subunit TssM [Derxia gummosa]
MKNFLRLLLSPVALTGIGLLALAALVWWGFPLIAFGDAHPFESMWVRLAIVLLVTAGYAGWIAWRITRRKRANAKLVQGLVAGPSAIDREQQVLDARFREALDLLRTLPGREGKGGGNLYELPWYVFVGAPGSGKTTALLNAGLTFPLADKMGRAEVKGTGGTRNCDWWFTEDAVLIDTAGRYATQESDAAVDGAAWDSFLALLRRARPRQPINGVLLTVSVADLLQLDEARCKEQAARLRARLQELHARLGVRAPVYVCVTKADLIAGFDESFTQLGKEAREQVWGFSFDLKAGDALAGFDAEYAALEDRLRRQLLRRIEGQLDTAARAAVFAFPQQFALLRSPLSGFLRAVFAEGGGLEEAALLRGVYFTSGTQEGTPIDRVMGALSRGLGVGVSQAAFAPGKGKSYFLHRLLRDVVFAERDLVGANATVEARRRMLRRASFAAVGIASALVVAGWIASWLNNRAYIAEVEARLPAVRQAVDALPPASSGDAAPMADVLAAVRSAAWPQGYAVEEPPFLHGLGLYQGGKLDAGARIGYRHLLDHGLMPRIARRLEERLRAADRNNLELAYEALKSYLMLYTPEHFDPATLKAFIELDWELNLGATLTPEQRVSLSQDLDAAFAEGAPIPAVKMDETLVASVREMLAAYPLEYRIFSRLKRQRLGADLPEFSVTAAAGPGAASVFERASGKPLTAGIPGLFTRDGYHKAFKSSLDKVAGQLAAEEPWVMGRPGGGVAATALAGKEMAERVRKLFLDEYIKVWDAYLADVRLVRLGGLDRSLQVARAVAAPDSPLAAWVRAVGRETTLVPPKSAVADAASVAAGKVAAARNEMAALMGDTSAAPGLRGGPPEQVVDDHFAAIRRLSEGNPPPLDGILKQFNEVFVQLSAVDAAQKSKSPPPPGGGAERIKAEAGLQPEPIRSMLANLADAGASQSRVAERQTLSDELRPITDFCQRAIAGRYPFAAGAKSDAMPEDFAQLFGAGGLLDDFWQRRLAAIVDTGANPWGYKPLSDGTRPPTPAALADFQRATRIRDVFFRGGGKTPGFRVDIRALDLDGLPMISLDIDGQVAKFTGAGGQPATVQWPPQRLASQIRLATSDAGPAQVFDGPWALFRLFDRYEIQQGNQPERFVVVVTEGGHKAKLEVVASSVFNPFRLREMQQFRCPSAL